MKFGKMPLEMGVDVIAVSSLAFKRFLDIALVLNADVDVVTDNDGDLDKLKKKYADYDVGQIGVPYDEDVSCTTLEPQLVKTNGLQLVQPNPWQVYSTEDKLLKHMRDNKTESASKFFEDENSVERPGIIPMPSTNRAIISARLVAENNSHCT